MRSILLLIVASCVTLAGCGGSTVHSVSGTVTLDGNPIEGLLVAFAPTGEGISGAGRTNASGNYTITSIEGNGLPAGMYRVSIDEIITVSNAGPEMSELEQGSDNAAYEQQATGNPSDYTDAARKAKQKLIPDKYNSETTLQETVAKVSNTIDFALTSK